MTTPTDVEIKADHDAFDARLDAELLANPPEGYANAQKAWEKWHKEPWKPSRWRQLTFGDQADYARGDSRNPKEWMPDQAPLDITAKALRLVRSPSIMSGHRVWAFDLLEYLDRQGWKLVRK
jgi:hypothetical protein